MSDTRYPDRRWVVFDTSETGSIDFSQVLQTSVNTLRLNTSKIQTQISKVWKTILLKSKWTQHKVPLQNQQNYKLTKLNIWDQLNMWQLFNMDQDMIK